MTKETRRVKGLYKQELNAKKYTMFFNSLYEELISEIITPSGRYKSLGHFALVYVSVHHSFEFEGQIK